jgi:TPR repeat protein
MDTEQLISLAHEKRFNGDLIEAEKLYMEAAKQGSGHAAHELGVIYITGGEGLKPDFEKAQYWLQISLESGFEATISNDPEWFKKTT